MVEFEGSRAADLAEGNVHQQHQLVCGGGCLLAAEGAALGIVAATLTGVSTWSEGA